MATDDGVGQVQDFSLCVKRKSVNSQKLCEVGTKDFAEVVLLIRSNLCSRSLLREVGLCLHAMLTVKTNPTMSSTDNKQT